MKEIVSTRTARRSWPCEQCDVPIEPGQLYRRIACPPDIDVPRWSVYRVHVNGCQLKEPDDNFPGWDLSDMPLVRLRREPGEIPGEYVIGEEA